MICEHCESGTHESYECPHDEISIIWPKRELDKRFISLTEDKLRALNVILTAFAEEHGEDIVGMFIRTGASKQLKESRTIDLVKLIENYPPK